jgi:hypothetical protein
MSSFDRFVLWKWAWLVSIGVVALIVLFVIAWAMADTDTQRTACEEIGMLYSPDVRGCVEGVKLP